MFDYKKKYLKYKNKYLNIKGGALYSDEVTIYFKLMSGATILTLQANRVMDANSLSTIKQQINNAILTDIYRLVKSNSDELCVNDELNNNDIITVVILTLSKVFPSAIGFAVLKTDGSVYTLPNAIDTIPANESEFINHELSSDVKIIFTAPNFYSYVAKKINDNIISWTPSEADRYTTIELSEPAFPLDIRDKLKSGFRKIIFFNYTQCAAITNENKLIFWGPKLMRLSSKLVSECQDEIDDIYNSDNHNSNWLIFIKKKTGKFLVINTNMPNYQVEVFDIPELNNLSIKQIFNNFVLLKTDQIITFKNPAISNIIYTPNPDQELNIAKVYSNTSDWFCALKNDGSVLIWTSQNIINLQVQREIAELPLLKANLGSDVQKIFIMHNSFIALKSNNRIMTWGKLGRMNLQLHQTVKEIYCTNDIFIAYYEDNTVEWWGEYTGSIFNVRITEICTRKYKNSIALLTEDKHVLVIGNPQYIPNADITAQLINVQSIYSNNDLFAALTYDDTVIVWR
jgi:hypothetical protein